MRGLAPAISASRRTVTAVCSHALIVARLGMTARSQSVDNCPANASDLENMNQPRSVETVAILGASPKPDRYAYQALQMLREYGHRPLPINPAFDEILGEKCYPTISDAPGPIDTVTLYLGEARSNSTHRRNHQRKTTSHHHESRRGEQRPRRQRRRKPALKSSKAARS